MNDSKRTCEEHRVSGERLARVKELIEVERQETETRLPAPVS